MAAPAPISNPAVTGVQVYYIPRDGDPPNAGAAYLSAFTATRTAWTNQVLMRRLAALDPTEQQKQLNQLVAEKGRLLDAQASSGRVGAQVAQQQANNEVEILKLQAQARIADKKNQTDVQVARIGQDTELLKAGNVTHQAALDVLGGAQSAVNAAVANIAAGRGTVDENVRALQNALYASRETLDGSGLKGTPEALGVANQLNATQIPIDDPAVVAKIKGTIGAYFPPEIRGNIPNRGVGNASGDVDKLIADFLGSGSPAATGTRGSTGSAAASGPPRGGRPTAGDPLTDAISAIDDLIAQRQAAYDRNPFGKLGGFRDPLYGLGKQQFADAPLVAKPTPRMAPEDFLSFDAPPPIQRTAPATAEKTAPAAQRPAPTPTKPEPLNGWGMTPDEGYRWDVARTLMMSGKGPVAAPNPPPTRGPVQLAPVEDQATAMARAAGQQRLDTDSFSDELSRLIGMLTYQGDEEEARKRGLTVEQWRAIQASMNAAR